VRNTGKRVYDEPDHWSEIVGMPDEVDIKNLNALITNFKADHFEVYGRMMTGQQWISYEVADAKEQMELSGVGAMVNPHGVKSKETELRVGTAMPYVLWNAIERAYPTMFRDKKHFDWFCKNFREFVVASRY
jgi:hypothetical protein